MNKFSLVFGMLSILTVSSFSFALNVDGCFQLYKPAALYPVVCIDGAYEEGVDGQGVRVAIIGPNSETVRFCGLTSRMSYEDNGNSKLALFDFENAIDNIRMNGRVSLESNQEEGSISVGKSTYQYVRVSEKDASRLMKAAYQSGKCNP